MSLSPFQFWNGLLSLLTVSISFLVGLIMIIKYFQYRKKELLYVGLAWTAVYQPWWPGTLAFLLNVFGIINGSIGAVLYILIATMAIPATSFAWFMGVTEMIYEGRRSVIVGLYLIGTSLMSLFIIACLIVDPTILGSVGVVNSDYGIIMTIYLMVVNLSVAISGALMGRGSLKSKIPQVQLRGKFLIAASVCYFLGGLLDVGLIESFPWIIFLSRTILMSGSLLFYLGFLLPKPLEQLLLKE